MEKNENTGVLTFTLLGKGPEYEAICKGEGDRNRLIARPTGDERLYDPAGSSEGVEILRFSSIRISNVFGHVLQKIQKTTPNKDVDVELSGEVAEKVLSYYARNPDKKYKLVLASEKGLF